jgi:hypothetical protein
MGQRGQTRPRIGLAISGRPRWRVPVLQVVLWRPSIMYISTSSASVEDYQGGNTRWTSNRGASLPGDVQFLTLTSIVAGSPDMVTMTVPRARTTLNNEAVNICKHRDAKKRDQFQSRPPALVVKGKVRLCRVFCNSAGCRRDIQTAGFLMERRSGVVAREPSTVGCHACHACPC